MYEVEVKFQVDRLDLLEERLTELGVTFGGEIEEYDQFYQHPSRDFAETDECLRIRRNSAGQCFLTYKGPKVDTQTKTRQEIEMPLEHTETFQKILFALGFERRDSVQKFRREGTFLFQDRQFNILLDRLPGLVTAEHPGTFVELETLAEPELLEESRRAVLELARFLGLEHSIQTSYLGLLKGKSVRGANV